MGEVTARFDDNHQLSFFIEIWLVHMVISIDRIQRQNSNKTYSNVYFVSPLKVRE